jgi:hypothetical protein
MAGWSDYWMWGISLTALSTIEMSPRLVGHLELADVMDIDLPERSETRSLVSVLL